MSFKVLPVVIESNLSPDWLTNKWCLVEGLFTSKRKKYICEQWSRMGLKWCYLFSLLQLRQSCYNRWNEICTSQFLERCNLGADVIQICGFQLLMLAGFSGSGPKSVRIIREVPLTPVSSSTSWARKRYRVLEYFLILWNAQASQQLTPVKWT